ncbi:MAG: hypothetical protein IKC24_04425 [Oscillospiraceae bacterium]|nr:hypothetical protein [Oscillospiraceae bacterium]
MAKTKKNLKKIQAKSKQKMDKLTGLFGIGCVAELVLFVVHQFYTRGTGAQMMGAARVLGIMPVVGIVLLVTGVVIHRGEMTGIRPAGVYVSGFGAFLALLGPLCLKVNSGAAGLLAAVVPAVMLLAVVFVLYSRDFFWLALNAAVAMDAIWYWNRFGAIDYLRLSALVLMALALIVAIAVLALTVLSKKNKGVATVRGREIRMMESGEVKVAMLAGHVLVLAAIAVALVSGFSVYCLMALGVMLFVSAAYFTVTAL